MADSLGTIFTGQYHNAYRYVFCDLAVLHSHKTWSVETYNAKRRSVFLFVETRNSDLILTVLGFVQKSVEASLDILKLFGVLLQAADNIFVSLFEKVDKPCESAAGLSKR